MRRRPFLSLGSSRGARDGFAKTCEIRERASIARIAADADGARSLVAHALRPATLVVARPIE